MHMRKFTTIKLSDQSGKSQYLSSSRLVYNKTMPKSNLELPPPFSYTSEYLKDVLRQAWEAEVKDRETALGRSLSAEEKSEIKITSEFMDRWHKRGVIPSMLPYRQHFGSIVHLAQLLNLPSSGTRPRETYYEGDRSEYIQNIRFFIKEFEEKNGRKPTRTDIRNAINHSKIPGVSTGVLNHNNIKDLFSILGIESNQGRRS